MWTNEDIHLGLRHAERQLDELLAEKPVPANIEALLDNMYENLDYWHAMLTLGGTD